MFDVTHLFIGISKVTIDDLEILPCRDFEFDPSKYQIKCLFDEYQDSEKLHNLVRNLNQNLLEAKKLTSAKQVSFIFVSDANDRYKFIFSNVELTFSYKCDLVLLVIDFTPTTFKIEKLTKD